jgi:hypothetical protein
MAPIKFMPLLGGHAQSMLPERGVIDAGLRLDRGKHRVWNADIGHHNVPAKPATGIEHMARLHAEKSDRFLSGHHRALSLARVPVET